MVSYWPTGLHSQLPTSLITRHHGPRAFSLCCGHTGLAVPPFEALLLPSAWDVFPPERGLGGHASLQLFLQYFAQCKDLSVKPSWHPIENWKCSKLSCHFLSPFPASFFFSVFIANKQYHLFIYLFLVCFPTLESRLHDSNIFIFPIYYCFSSA